MISISRLPLVGFAFSTALMLAACATPAPTDGTTVAQRSTHECTQQTGSMICKEHQANGSNTYSVSADDARAAGFSTSPVVNSGPPTGVGR